MVQVKWQLWDPTKGSNREIRVCVKIGEVSPKWLYGLSKSESKGMHIYCRAPVDGCLEQSTTEVCMGYIHTL